MATITKTMTKQEIEQLKEKLKPFTLKLTQPEYTFYQIKTENCTITAYTSLKVVFQGKDLDWLESNDAKDDYPQAGSDEVGTGDYFGPVTVAACIVDAKAAVQLKPLGIQDSKQITDPKIRKLAAKIKEVCPHSILVVQNAKYNRVHQSHNMVDIKCRLHNQAYVNLKNKGYTLPERIIIDQFVQEKSYYRYLQNEQNVIHGIHFETKAENKYLAVACASILARNAFLESLDKMEEAYDFHFEKGAGPKVDQCAQAFVDRFGPQELEKVAKLHFKNTEKLHFTKL
ncbi:ribonuclease HIII [uncultured Faecalicoccus sp.]|uniref:ribonuclease HIII n=1 Tax=uncultured Faecalicoccus sp. TaxID=1971760 RepID=UPI0025E4493C|nr:ribonuclease HIII [uncultured Faecalicoccus sp.]